MEEVGGPKRNFQKKGCLKPYQERHCNTYNPPAGGDNADIKY